MTDRGGCDRTDIELVGRLRLGDAGALAALFDEHHAGCLGFARRLVGPSEVEDVVSEAFLAMVAAIENGHGPRRSVRAYLHQAIWSSASRRWSRRDEPVASVGALASVAVSDGSEGPELERFVDRGELAHAMAALAPRWRRVIWMVEVEGCTMAEVGQRLDIAPAAAAALAYRARKALRAAYFGGDAGVTSGADAAPVLAA